MMIFDIFYHIFDMLRINLSINLLLFLITLISQYIIINTFRVFLFVVNCDLLDNVILELLLLLIINFIDFVKFLTFFC